MTQPTPPARAPTPAPVPTTSQSANVQAASRACRALLQEVGRTIVGKPVVLEKALIGILTGGHVLFEDYPGLGKTLLVKTFARASGLEFSRIQFTPDLLPSDITGTHVFNAKTSEFTLRKGPVFTNLLLADEINRAPPKTQSALLEAMAEGQTTLEGTTLALPQPFLVFATQNPIEQEGTYPLPEAQMDRFMLRLSVGHPAEEEEVEVLRRSEGWADKDPPTQRVVDARTLVLAQEAARGIKASDDVKRYMVKLVHATRRDPRVSLGASPRGSLALLKAAKAHALLRGRDFVTPDDVKAVSVEALSHRLILTPESRVRLVRPQQVIADALQMVPLPPVAKAEY
ncbi:MAG TPA: MoxR family ATPase [Candidatus Thermoplasmatota archaeon]|nr:MoxR family ATPase [Candidatus Thermoplasmatota archaeon]